MLMTDPESHALTAEFLFRDPSVNISFTNVHVLLSLRPM